METPSESNLPVMAQSSPALKMDGDERAEEGQSAITHVIVRRSTGASWAVAAVFISIIGAATFLIYCLTVRLPEKAIDTGASAVVSSVQRISQVPERIAAAFKPTVNLRTLVNSGIDKVKHESKLIVLTADVDVEIGKTSEKSVLWESLKLGDTTVRVRAHDNQVQYYLPLEAFGEEQVHFDAQSNSLVVRVPAPILDTHMVSVQSDPNFIETQTDVGWGRLKMYSGEFLMAQARTELRKAVLCEGANPLLQEKAKSEAQNAVRSLLAEWLPSLREGVDIQVQFIDPRVS